MVKSPQLGSCFEITEDIFSIRGDKYMHAGKRKVTGKVISESHGIYNIEVLGSTGINALPKGITIQRGGANLVHVVDCTGKLPEYVLTTYSGDQTFKSGGQVEGYRNGKKIMSGSAEEGGIGVGSSHADGGIKGEVGSQKRPIEFQGGEIILKAEVATDTRKHEIDGKMMTPRQMASYVNVLNGGVDFADGGEVKSCRCQGRMFNYGGETISDFQVIERINRCGCDHEKQRYDILSKLNAGSITLDDAFEQINKTF